MGDEYLKLGIMDPRLPLGVRQTQAAEGLPRRGFTVAEVERMVACGILREDERLELIGGELVPMSPKGLRHEAFKEALNRTWIPIMPEGMHVVPGTTFRLSVDTYFEPDFIVYRSPVRLRDISGTNVQLAVEIADSTLGYDLHRKPAIYAGFGVRELWVVDAVRRVIHVHEGPGDGGYARITVASADTPLRARLVPELPLRLDDLDLDWED